MANTKEKPAIPTYVRFFIGGLSGVGATCVTHPLDFMKTRMQLSGEGSLTKEHKNTINALRTIVGNEGIAAVYSGLTAGILRQAVYTSGRLGFYSLFVDLGTKKDGTAPGVLWKSFSGMASGVLGALMGNPADVALIRMAADGRLPPAERRNYKNAIEAITRIVREEGFLAAYSGTVPTVTRAVVVNVSQVVTYTQLKETFLKRGLFQDDIKCHLAVSMIAGAVTVVASMPVDIAKTRLQNMKTTAGIPQYTGMLDVWASVIRIEGVLALWKGITPSYLRIGPQTVIFFLLLENLTRLYRIHVLKDETSGGFT